MVQSVELLLDRRLDAAVRREWDLLVAADLPSQARHTGASNAPHVTLGVTTASTPEAEEALARVHVPVGAAVHLGGLLVFTGRTHVLARVVVPSPALLRLHADVEAATTGLPGRPPTMAPGRWTPHVTLARRLDDDALAAALRVLFAEPAELEGTVAGLRRWDGDARRAWVVGD